MCGGYRETDKPAALSLIFHRTPFPPQGDKTSGNISSRAVLTGRFLFDLTPHPLSAFIRPIRVPGSSPFGRVPALSLSKGWSEGKSKRPR